MTNSLTSDEREERQQTPEQIFIIPTKQWGLIPTATRPTQSDYVEYVRGDIAATRMRDKCVALVRALAAEVEDGDALLSAKKVIAALQSVTLE